jgi:hypothetical protein
VARDHDAARAAGDQRFAVVSHRRVTAEPRTAAHGGTAARRSTAMALPAGSV